jgi:hypothetical protein
MLNLSLDDATIISSVVRATKVEVPRRLKLLERASKDAQKIGRYLIAPTDEELSPTELEAAEQIRSWTAVPQETSA